MRAVAHLEGGLTRLVRSPEITGRSWSVDSAYRFCETLARSHYENFPVGSLLIPSRLRKHVYAIYAFARIADDFADEDHHEGYSQQDRLGLLTEWRDMLRGCFRGEATHPVFIALKETVSRFDLPVELFEDLLSAFAQDVTTHRYRTVQDLLDYCRRSANPVGRLVLLLFDYKEESLHFWSDYICTGLQLANHWQDVEVDLRKGRVYLPEEDLVRFGLGVDDLAMRHGGSEFRKLMRFEVGRARELFLRGRPLCVSVRGRLGLELRAVWLGGWRILDLIERNGFDVFGQRPVISNGDKARILLAAIRRGAFQGNQWSPM